MTRTSELVGPEVLKQVKNLELRTRHLVGNLFSGEYRSVFKGHGIEFAEVRAYEHGDDYRAIDWNVSARMGHPYVKTFEEERELTLLLIVDRSGSIDFGSPTTKAQMALELGAVLSLAAARHHDRVGALIFSDGVDHVIPPAKGRRHALRVIRDLIAFQPEGRGTNLAAALSYAARLLRSRAIVVVISDLRATGWEDPLQRLTTRHEVVAITIDDPREMELPDAGWIELVDAERNERVLVDTSDQRTRLQLQIAAEDRRMERARILRQTGADQISLHTDRPYATELLRAFAERARRMKR